MFFVALITFTLAHLAPGSPFDRTEAKGTVEQIERRERLYGLDKPIPEQFVIFLGNAVRLDFGDSLTRNRSVSDIIGQGIGTTATLGALAVILAVIVALPLGIVSALRQNTIVDFGSLFFATIGTTIPNFVVGIFLIYLFGVTLKVLPIVGWGDLRHMMLPVVVLALAPTAILARITRASMLEAIRQDYVRTARSKGLRERAVIVSHVLKNALIPVATLVGPIAAGLITGSFIVENLFSVPGIGREFVRSINQRDYPVIMATTMLYAFAIAAANLIVDVVYGLIDPRIKVSSQ